jgi:hypothetical protein
MEQHGAEVWGLLRPGAGGCLYLCGDAKHMAKDVHRTLHDIIVKVCWGNLAPVILRVYKGRAGPVILRVYKDRAG